MKDAIGYVENEIIRELTPLLAEDLAKQVAERVTNKVREQLGGDQPYIAKRSHRQMRERNKRIVLDWRDQRSRGKDDRMVLAEKHDVHVTTINRVISKYLARKSHHSPDPDDTWVF